MKLEEKKECTGSFTLSSDGITFKTKEHQHNQWSLYKDGDIETLKLKYKYGELEVMDYLMKVSVLSKNYDD